MIADSSSWLKLTKKVRFGDTDAAGVMHFHQLLRWCHESWEESLQTFGVQPTDVFPGCRGQHSFPDVALPVVHCSTDFLGPVHAGDGLVVTLEPRRLDPGSFEVSSNFLHAGSSVARGLLRHVAIKATTRRRCNLPEGVDRWLEASGLGRINPL